MSNLPHTVERSVLLDASPSEVWQALTDAELLSEWLADEVELDPREGGELICRFGDGEERRGEVALVEEAERLAFRWWRDRGPGAVPEESRVDLFVDAVADGTRVTVVETGAPVGPLLGAPWAHRLGGVRLALGRLVPA